MSKFLGLDCFVNRTNESHGSGHNYLVLLVISCATLSRIVIRLRRGLVGSAAGNIPHPERFIGMVYKQLRLSQALARIHVQ